MSIDKSIKQTQNKVNKAFQLADKALAFIQQPVDLSFGIDFKDISKELDYIANSKDWADTIEKKQYQNNVRQLNRELKGLKIIYDVNKYYEFNELGKTISNLDILNGAGVRQVISVSDKIANDVENARNWLKSYNDLRINNAAFNKNSYEDLHNQLVILGKSILARSNELCPIDTGALRASGQLWDFGNYIIIVYAIEYAVYVHENLEISHPWHMDSHGLQRNCHGQAKFLETAVQEFFPDRTVWTESLNNEFVAVQIGLNPDYVKYYHYN